MNFRYQDLIELFNRTFAATYNTHLVKGDDEPVYLPATDPNGFHQVVFAHGYFASALHEIAHWCIAGAQRRLREDYGYWYAPDGRDAKQQAAFEEAEVKPQAIEWAFCLACGKGFRVSTDNLNGVEVDTAGFTGRVAQQLNQFISGGFPPRAEAFIQVLRSHYHQPPLSIQHSSEDLADVR